MAFKYEFARCVRDILEKLKIVQPEILWCSYMRRHTYYRKGGLYGCAVAIEGNRVCTMIARYKKGRKLKVVGIGNAVSSGIVDGTIVDVEEASKAIVESLEQAKKTTDFEPSSAWICMSGPGVGVVPVHDMAIASPGEDGITFDDINELHTSLNRIPAPEGKVKTWRSEYEYFVDGTRVDYPHGLCGKFLEASYQLGCVDRTAFLNLREALVKAGMDDDEEEEIRFSFQMIWDYMLTEYEKSLEYIMILNVEPDIMNIALYENGSLFNALSLQLPFDRPDHCSNNTAVSEVDLRLKLVQKNVPEAYWQSRMVIHGERCIVENIEKAVHVKNGGCNRDIRILKTKGIKGLKRYKDDPGVIGALAMVFRMDQECRWKWS